ncbi:1-phosphofructokinase [Oscillospiraceae bacterium MB08-C2-2]|nr:1-phosphofructokinase [Oscillospiraceae bacterium MB08-C2-2]
MITTVTLNASLDKLYLVESMNPQSVMRVRQVVDTAGGKGLNVSKAIALLGEMVEATGFLGGHNGRYIRQLLGQTGIRDSFTAAAGNTRICINVRDMRTQKHTEFLEPGQDISPRELEAFLTQYQAALAASCVTVISGSVPGNLPADIYATLVRMARQAGVAVILDTSGQPLKQAVAERPTLIKPNTDEIAQIMGAAPANRQELIESAQSLHAGGIEYVVISLGKEGCILVCKEGVFQSNALDALEVVNTVGCGDCMVAGFAVGLLHGYDAPTLLGFASAVANANAMTLETGSFDPTVVPQLQKEIEVKQLH